MENDMIERVAKALFDAVPDESMSYTVGEYRNLARAAIEAMREPTEAMGKAGDQFIDDFTDADQVYRAMIDAALSGSAAAFPDLTFGGVPMVPDTVEQMTGAVNHKGGSIDPAALK